MKKIPLAVSWTCTSYLFNSSEPEWNFDATIQNMGKSPTPDREPGEQEAPPDYTPYLDPQLTAESGGAYSMLTIRGMRKSAS